MRRSPPRASCTPPGTVAWTAAAQAGWPTAVCATPSSRPASAVEGACLASRRSSSSPTRPASPTSTAASTSTASEVSRLPALSRSCQVSAISLKLGGFGDACHLGFEFRLGPLVWLCGLKEGSPLLTCLCTSSYHGSSSFKAVSPYWADEDASISGQLKVGMATFSEPNEGPAPVNQTTSRAHREVSRTFSLKVSDL